MRACWIKAGSESNDWFPYKKKEIWTDTHTHRAGYEKMETEFVMMNL